MAKHTQSIFLLTLLLLTMVFMTACTSINTDEKKDINPAAVGKKDGGSGAGQSSYFMLGIPDCPENIQGILTAPMIDLDKVSSIIPLGNIAPPGHTSPVDHNYFNTLSEEKIPL